jgi:hypothetical protein
MEGCSWSRDDGFKEEFGSGEVGGWHCFVPRVINVGADDSEASSFLFFLLRPTPILLQATFLVGPWVFRSCECIALFWCMGCL